MLIHVLEVVLFLKEEENSEIINAIKSRLSRSELVIFELKLKGLNNTEISELLNKSKKYVENTMFRINKKYKELLDLGIITQEEFEAKKKKILGL